MSRVRRDVASLTSSEAKATPLQKQSVAETAHDKEKTHHSACSRDSETFPICLNIEVISLLYICFFYLLPGVAHKTTKYES